MSSNLGVYWSIAETRRNGFCRFISDLVKKTGVPSFDLVS